MLAGIAGLILLDRLFSWMEQKGWIYYRKKKSAGSGGPAVLDVASIFDPSTRYAAETRQERAGEEDEDDGDDDGKRKPEDRLAGKIDPADR